MNSPFLCCIRFVPAGALASLALFVLASCERGGQEDAIEDLVKDGQSFDAAGFEAAIRAGDGGLVERYLEAGFLPESATASGESPLVVAIESAQPAVVELLLARGADPERTTLAGKPPLSLAASLGQAGVVEALIAAGADPKREDEGGKIPLSVAVLARQKQGDLETLKVLVPYASERDVDAAFLIACMTGNMSLVDYLYSEGANVFYQTSNGFTPLIYAARRGNLDVVRFLLARGVDPYAMDAQQHTAGWHAAQLLQAEQARVAADGEAGGELGQGEIERLARLEVMTALLNEAPQEMLGLGEPELEEGMLAGWEQGGEASGGGAALESLQDAVLAGNPAEGNLLAELGQGTRGEQPSEAERILLSLQGEGVESGSAEGDGAQAEGDSALAAEGSQLVEQDWDAPKRQTRFEGLRLEEYHSASLPLVFEGRGAAAGTARLRLLYGAHQRVDLAAGEQIPGSSLRVVSLSTRLVEGGKESFGEPVERLEVLVEDSRSGQRETLMEGKQLPAGEPWAVIASSERFLQARVGDRFQLGGRPWEVMEMRQGQVLLRSLETGEVVTLQR